LFNKDRGRGPDHGYSKCPALSLNEDGAAREGDHAVLDAFHRFRIRFFEDVEDKGDWNPEVISRGSRSLTPIVWRKPNGMGMGLSICRSIVQNHDGRVWAMANDGPGASFHFSLKYHGAELSQESAPMHRTR
jgi:nitrogen fixation/metabolism regulation signal transduction histidine kinase